MTVHSAPMIAVSDVVASRRWYQRLLNCHNEHPGDDEYAKLVDGGENLLMLHCWDAAPEVAIDRYFAGRDAAPVGHGVLLTFAMEDLAAAEARALAMNCEIIETMHSLPDRSLAFWVRDPDGYMLQLSSPGWA